MARKDRSTATATAGRTVKMALVHDAQYETTVDVRLRGVELEGVRSYGYLRLNPPVLPMLSGMGELEQALIRNLRDPRIAMVELWPDRLRWKNHPLGADNRINGVYRILGEAGIGKAKGRMLPTDVLMIDEATLSFGDLHQAFWGEVKNFEFQVTGLLVESGMEVLLEARVCGLINPYGQRIAQLLVREAGTERRWQFIEVPVGGNPSDDTDESIILYELEDN